MAELHEYKCPACGGALEFNSSIQKMKCPFCDSVYTMEELQNVDSELNQTEETAKDTSDLQWDTTAEQFTDSETDGMKVYVCQSCGGEIVGDANMAATSCPYCGNPVVVMGQFKGALKPDYVIPFKMNKDQAMEAYSNHLKGKKMLPRVFKDQNKIKEIQGVYVPFWLFDAKANANMTYKASKVKEWKDQQFAYKETSYYTAARGGSMEFEHVPVDGSKKMEDTLMQSLEPFNFGDAVNFQTAYLAGYVADRYDVDQSSTIQTANERVTNSVKEYFASTVEGYDTVEQTSQNIQIQDGTAKYALYPVWMLSTQYKDKAYTFAMNGQTGKFVGDLPVDEGAYKKRWWSVFAITTAVVFLLSLLLTEGFSIFGLAAAVVIGLIAAAIAGSAAKNSMISVREETKANNYTKNNVLSLTQDTFLRKEVEKVPLNNGQGGPNGGPGGNMNAMQNGAMAGSMMGAGNRQAPPAGPGMNGGRPMGGPSNQAMNRPNGNGMGAMAGNMNTRPAANAKQAPRANTNARPVGTAPRPANNTSRPVNTASRPTASSPGQKPAGRR